MKTTRRLPCLLVLFVILGSIFASAQRCVEISGELDTINYLSGNTNNAIGRRQLTIPFFCAVGSNEWRVDDHFEDAEEKCFFDGTNVYLAVQISAKRPETVKGEISTGMPFKAAAPHPPTINVYPTPDGRPRGAVHQNIPWLAFCSGTYLKRGGRIIPLPVASNLAVPDRYGYSDKTESFDDDLGLPRTVGLFTSGKLYEAAISNYCTEFLIDLEASKRKSRFRDGILKFHYAVTESTNFLGQNFPLKFEYREYEPEAGSNWVLRCEGHGRVTSIRVSAKIDSIFVQGMKQTICDRRFHDEKYVNGILYTTTNDFLAPTNDPALQKKFAALRERVQTPQTNMCVPASTNVD